jgi:hypothetical protein
MTLDVLLNKWGYSFSFMVTIIRNTASVISAVDLDRIKEFTEDVESYFNALINADITGSLNNGNLSPLKFRASVKEPINYQVGEKLSNALKKFTDGSGYGPSSSLFSVNYTIEQLFENKDLWESYFKAERELKNQAATLDATLDTVSIYPDSTTASEPINLIDVAEKEIKTISLKPKKEKFIGRNNVSASWVYNKTSRLYDYQIRLQTSILLNSIKRYLEDQTVTALGVLKKKGETTIETIETPEIGNWKTVIEEDGTSTFIELKKDEIIQEMKDLMDPQVGKEYHSYSIQEVGNDIRIVTTPFDKEPFDVKIEDIKLEE